MSKINQLVYFSSLLHCCQKLLCEPVIVTIGNDIDTSECIEEMGETHIVCPVNYIVVDAQHKVVTTPAYILANSISEAAKGIDKLRAGFRCMR